MFYFGVSVTLYFNPFDKSYKTCDFRFFVALIDNICLFTLFKIKRKKSINYFFDHV